MCEPFSSILASSFFFLIFIYLFIWLRQELVAACGLFHVACGLSCPVACGILVPRPGIEPAFLALEGVFLTTGPPGKSPSCLLFEVTVGILAA